jgi:hypothetical protein
VDDSVCEQYLFFNILGDLGHHVVLSHSFQPYLDELRAAKSREEVPYSHIIMDWHLLPLDMDLRLQVSRECQRLGIPLCVHSSSTNLDGQEDFTVFEKPCGYSSNPLLVEWLKSGCPQLSV